MTFKQLALVALALASYMGMAAAGEFPLPWICLAITVVGIVIVFVIAGRHPDRLEIPGATVMTAQDRQFAEGLPSAKYDYEQEPTTH